jgi:hypothetical protein
MRALRTTSVSLCLLLAAASGVAASELGDALQSMQDGRLRFSFPTKEGVWGDGHNIISSDRGRREWTCDCEEGPGRVQIRFRDGEIRDVKFRVGGHWTEAREGDFDLGEVDPAEASRQLLEYAVRGGEEDLIFPATLAEGFDDWRRILDIARNRDVDEDVREQCVFWLGQEASDVATRGLEKIVDDDDEELEIREHAIFALSQNDDDRVFDSLRDIALHNRHPQLREQAMFWLGQVDDPRVLDFFEEVLFSDDGG